MSSHRDKKQRKFTFSLNVNSFTASTFGILFLMILAGVFEQICTPAIITAFAQEENNNDNTMTNSTAVNTLAIAFPSEIPLSPQPIYRESVRTVSVTPINQTHTYITFSGNGTLTMPNSTETINTTSNGSAFLSFMTQSAYGKETIMTLEPSVETATGTFYEILQVNAITGEREGIIIAIVHTDSTGDVFAPLNGMVVTGIDDIQPNGESLLTFWEWKSRAWNSDIASRNEQESPMNTKHLGLRQ